MHTLWIASYGIIIFKIYMMYPSTFACFTTSFVCLVKENDASKQFSGIVNTGISHLSILSKAASRVENIIKNYKKLIQELFNRIVGFMSPYLNKTDLT